MLRINNGGIYIPTNSKNLRLVGPQDEPAGHRGTKATIPKVSEIFWWSSRNTDVGEYLKSCQACLQNEGKGVLPRPMGHLDGPSQVLYFELLYIGPCTGGANYV